MTARFFFTFAVQMQVIVLGWRMYELTKDALHLGLIGLAEAVPALSLALFAGYIVDRGSPLTILRRAQYMSFLSAFLLLASQSNFFFSISNNHQVILLYVSSFLTGTSRAFSQPSMFSIIPRLVPRDLLAKASAWSSTALQIGRISGPAAGGLLFGFVGVGGASIAVCIFLLVTMISLWLIKFPVDFPVQMVKVTSVRKELLLGANFVIKHPILFPALTLDMVSVLFGGVTALLPIYAAEILKVGPQGLGILRAAPSVGAALMSFWLIRNVLKKKAGTWFLGATASFGVCILVFALSRNYMLSFAALFLSGVFDSVSVVVRSSAVQLASPANMRGRVSAVNSIFIGSSNELGEFESGVAAKLLGAVSASVLGGIICIATVGVVALMSPTLRKLDLDELSAT